MEPGLGGGGWTCRRVPGGWAVDPWGSVSLQNGQEATATWAHHLQGGPSWSCAMDARRQFLAALACSREVEYHLNSK